MPLPLSTFLNVEVNYLDPTANRPADMSTLLLTGVAAAPNQSSSNLSQRRVQRYDNLAAVSDAGWAVTSEAYLMAAAYFSAPGVQPPVFIGAWDNRVAPGETLSEALAAIVPIENTWHFMCVDSTIIDATSAQIDNAEIAALVTAIAGGGKDQHLLLDILTDDAYDMTNMANMAYILGNAEATAASGLVSGEKYAACVMAGIYSATDWDLPNVLRTAKFLRLPNIDPIDITTAQATVLEGRNCNYLAEYEQVGNFVSQGVTFSGRWFDFEFGLAWLKQAVTRDLAIRFTAPDPVPGTDAGAAELKAVAAAVLSQARNAGLIASNGRLSAVHRDQVRNLTNNPLFDGFLPGGFWVYSPSVSSRTTGQRARRAAPPITAYLVGHDAFHEGSVQLNFVGATA